MTSIKVTALLPCLNEEKTLPFCIRKIRHAFEIMGVQGEVLVADNGSNDASVTVAESFGATVIHVKTRGYGAALKAGIDAAAGEIIVMADADDSYDWGALGNFVEKIEQGYDLVMGNRFLGGIERGAMPWHHRYIGNPVLSFAARIAFEIPINDFHCGLRAFRKDKILKINLKSDGMEFATEMVANASRCGLKITEIPTRLHLDKRERPPHLRSFRDGWRHLKFILMYAPDYLYLVPGLFMFVLGCLGAALLSCGPVRAGSVYIGIHYLALSNLFGITGYSIVWMGLLAKVLMSNRFPLLATRFVALFAEKFNTERAILLGFVMAATGLSVDLIILIIWLHRQIKSMEDTVHPAFAATFLVAIGILTIFNSFLLSLVNEQYRIKTGGQQYR